MNALYLCMNEYLVHFRENQWSNMWYLDVCHLTAELCKEVNSSYKLLYAFPATDCTHIVSFPFNLTIFSYFSLYTVCTIFTSLFILFMGTLSPGVIHTMLTKNNKNGCPCLLPLKVITLSSMYHCLLWVYTVFNPLTHKSAMWHKRPLHAQYLVNFYQTA